MSSAFFPNEESAVGAGFDDANPYSWIMTAAQGAFNATASRGQQSLKQFETKAAPEEKKEPAPAPTPKPQQFKLPANFRIRRAETLTEKAKKIAPYAVMATAAGAAVLYAVRRFRR